MRRLTKTEMVADLALRKPDSIEAAFRLALINHVNPWKVVLRVLVSQGIAKFLSTGDSAGCILPHFDAFGRRCGCRLCRF